MRRENFKDVEVSLKEYEGKVLLIVNTATACGLTPQYQDIEELYKAYSSQGFEVLDFPCNQFGEPLAFVRAKDDLLPVFLSKRHTFMFRFDKKLHMG